MSRKKSLIQMLAACEKPDFDKVVKMYLKEIYSYKRIVQTDGKDDCGIDIKVFDFSDQKIQYQMTVQKSETQGEKTALKNKIFQDVAKAKENAEEYGWSNKLIFFYSHELTNKVIRDYEKEAFRDYSINLDVVDANQIAEESEEYLNLQQAIYDTTGLAEFKLKKSLYEDKNNNLIYDLVSFGRSVDIKLEIVEAYVLRSLYEQGAMDLTQISNLCKHKFSTDDNITFYTKLVKNLYSRKNKLYYDKSNKTYNLTGDAYDEITRQDDQIKLDEQQFLNQIGNILSKCNQEKNIDAYVDFLKNIYIESFDKRIAVQNNVDSLDALNTLISYIKKEVKDEADRVALIKSLIETCDNSKFLQKICASSIFSQKVNIDNLQRYAKERKQVFVDTTIALYILCYFYSPHCDYHSYNYQLSKSLCDFCKKSGINLFITNRYLREVGTHIQEAFNLVPFTKLPNFTLLGRSRNVFFNHYNYLIESNEIDISYEEYLAKFCFVNSNSIVNCQLAETYLNNMGITVVELPKYDIQTEVKIIGNRLSVTGRYKTNFALNNDAIMLKYLGDGNVDIHPIDSVFVTWDKTMFEVLTDFYKQNPAAHRWMQFTPSQFIDRYSLLSFSISEETISKEMLALLSGDIVQHTVSLVDSLSLILNLDEEVGLEYAQRFAQMKDSQIYTTSKSPDSIHESSESSAIDFIVSNIVSHYRDDNSKYDRLKILFSLKEYIDDVVEILNDAVNDYKVHKEFDKGIIKRFDDILFKIKDRITLED